MTGLFTTADYVILSVLVIGFVWVAYGVLKRVLVFLLAAAAALCIAGGVGYLQSGSFGKGFFAEKSAIVRVLGQLADGCCAQSQHE